VTSTTTSHTIGEPAQKSQTIPAPPFCHGVSAITSALVFLVSARVPLWNGFRFHPKGWSFEIVLPLTVKGKIEIEASGARRKGPLTSFTGIAVCRSLRYDEGNSRVLDRQDTIVRSVNVFPQCLLHSPQRGVNLGERGIQRIGYPGMVTTHGPMGRKM
jgi:hypothetical protein